MCEAGVYNIKSFLSRNLYPSGKRQKSKQIDNNIFIGYG